MESLRSGIVDWIHTLADLTCGENQIAKYTSNAGWACEEDADTLADFSCNTEEILVYSENNEWTCSSQSSGNTSRMTLIYFHINNLN